MENKHSFLYAYELIKTCLIHLKVEEAFNSIGSNIFFDFGKEIDVTYGNGKRGLRREWIIWIGFASWRITKKNKYLVGSTAPQKIIHSRMQDLLGDKLQSFAFCSQFLDMNFSFDGGYEVTTFFNWMEGEQWTIFLPDATSIRIDYPNLRAIKNIQNIVRQLPIIAYYKKLSTSIQGKTVSKIIFNDWDLPTFYFESDSSIHLEACLWRLEKNSNYVSGYLDEQFKKTESKLFNLIGKKLNQVDIANSMMDARFQFEGGFVLKTFSCSHIEEQWKICEKGKSIFCAKIPLLDNNQSMES